MKVALTVWENRISPVFDSAHMLLIAEIRNTEVIKSHYEPLNPDMPSNVAERLNGQNIEVLICGAISALPANLIETQGIKLIPFISGETSKVLESYALGTPIIPNFLMPGCGEKGRRRHPKSPPGLPRKKEVNQMPQKNGTGPKGKGSGTGKGRGGCKAGQGRKNKVQGKNGRRGSGKGNGCSKNQRKRTSQQSSSKINVSS